MGESKKIRVLIISHCSMNLNENNGRTLRNLFSKMDAENISHLFFHRGEIDAPFCDSFYCISDFDIKKSILHFKKAGGVVRSGENKIQTKKETDAYAKHYGKRPFMKLLRDFAWGLGTWKSKTLKKWLNDMSPNIIFFQASDAIFSHKIAKWIKDYLHIPMVMYWADDFYLKLNNQKGFLSNINNRHFKKIARSNIADSDNYCITPLMAEVYEKEFGKKFGVLQTSSFLTKFPKKEIKRPIVMSYLGNIGLGRCESLLSIGSIIEKYQLPISFSIYSSENRDIFLNKIKSGKGFVFKGEIPYDKVIDVMQSSDILVHVEDFSVENIEYCRYSLSTKIADSLASNRCLLCYGPSEVASLQYLSSFSAALIANNESELIELLIRICQDDSIVYKTAEKGLELFEMNHSGEVNCTKLANFLLSRINEN